MNARRVKGLVFLVAIWIPGCAETYSKTPCFDNCGSDATCQASCQEIGKPGTTPLYTTQTATDRSAPRSK